MADEIVVPVEETIIPVEEVIQPTEEVYTPPSYVPFENPVDFVPAPAAPVQETQAVEENPNAWVDPSVVVEEQSIVEDIVGTVVDAYEAVVETVSDGVDAVKEFFTGDEPVA